MEAAHAGSRRSAFGLALVVSLACDSEPQPSAGAAPSAAPVTSSSAAPAASNAPHSGRWTGRYRAQKAPVRVPEGVRYPAWSEDDGSARSGEGTIELEVAADGEVEGRASGALGAQELRGRIDDGMLRAGMQPAEGGADEAMTGLLVGEVSGARIEADLRVASGDGNLVREATVTLARP